MPSMAKCELLGTRQVKPVQNIRWISKILLPLLRKNKKLNVCAAWVELRASSSHMKAESYSVMLTLCDPMDYTVHGILQVRILEWVANPFSRGSSQPRDQTQVSCIAVDSLLSEPPRKPMMGKRSPNFQWQVRARHKQTWPRGTWISRSSWHLLVNMLFYAVRSETHSGDLSLRHLGWAFTGAQRNQGTCPEQPGTIQPWQGSQKAGRGSRVLAVLEVLSSVPLVRSACCFSHYGSIIPGTQPFQGQGWRANSSSRLCSSKASGI